jgi:hypothetical protein
MCTANENQTLSNKNVELQEVVAELKEVRDN